MMAEEGGVVVMYQWEIRERQALETKTSLMEEVLMVTWRAMLRKVIVDMENDHGWK